MSKPARPQKGTRKPKAKPAPPAPPNLQEGPGRPIGLKKSSYTGSVRYPAGTKRLISNANSPWQKLIESRRIELGLSLRELEVISNKGGSVGLTFNKLWNWLRHPDGYPSPRSYTPALNNKLARALHLSPGALSTAYAAARAAHGLDGRDASESKIDFTLSLLAGDPRKTFTKAEVIALFKSLQ